MTTRQERLETESIDKLLNTVGIKPGDTIYCRLNHVSRSGMYRCISLFVIQNNEPWNISHIAAPLLEGYDEKHEGCKASGCGMDMGFHLVYNLSRSLFRDGFDCISADPLENENRCPANDHVNRWGYDHETKSHIDRGVPAHHSDGGYALKMRWL
jgi:hypothetical protein